MSNNQNPFILPKEYFEMRERISNRFIERLVELELHERMLKQKSVGSVKN